MLLLFQWQHFLSLSHRKQGRWFERQLILFDRKGVYAPNVRELSGKAVYNLYLLADSPASMRSKRTPRFPSLSEWAFPLWECSLFFYPPAPPFRPLCGAFLHLSSRVRASGVFLFFAFTSSPFGSNPLIYSRMYVKVSPSCASPRIGCNCLNNSEIRVKVSPLRLFRLAFTR